MSDMFGSAESCHMMSDHLSDPTLLDDPDALRMALQVAALHLRGAARRLEKRYSAQRSADAAMHRALAKLHSVEITEGFDPRGWFVYVLWGRSDDSPLYVGQSSNVLARLGSHLGDAKKRPAIERVTLVRCKDRTSMMKTELRLIRQYRPPWNTVGLAGSPEAEVS